MSGKERSRAAIVSTMRSPGPQLEAWLRWHSALGFERFYLFFDADPTEEDGARVAALPGVRVIVVDRRARARMAKDPYCAPLLPLSGEPHAPVGSPEQLTARQLCHVKVAIDEARREGIGWLLHIDADELFYPADRDAAAHFERLDALGIGYVIYDNHEALCERAEPVDPFREVTLFKKNPRAIAPPALAEAEPYFAKRGGYFLAYANGKAAVRTVPGAEPAGVHGFHLPLHLGMGRARFCQPAILHYPYSVFDGYWRKFQRLGWYEGKELLGLPWYPPLFELQSRDLALAGDAGAAREVFLKATVLRDRKKRDAWLGAGVLERIEGPARFLGGGDDDGLIGEIVMRCDRRTRGAHLMNSVTLQSAMLFDHARGGSREVRQAQGQAMGGGAAQTLREAVRAPLHRPRRSSSHVG